MPRITPVHWKVLECVFRKYGFKFERQSGSHRCYTKSGINRSIVIPKYNNIDTEIIRCNMKTAGMTREEYFNLLKKCK